MAYSTGTIAGTYRDFHGQPQSGTVTVIPSVTVVRDAIGDVVLAGRFQVALDDTGSFTAVVPASDDTTLDPTGVTYTVSARFRSSNLPAVTGVLVAAGTTVQMADVTPVDPATPTYAQQVTVSDVTALTTRVDALEAITVALDTDGVPFILIGA